MNKEYLTLISRIREELFEIEQIIYRTQAGWERAGKTGDKFYLDSVALNLHSFYTALERIFELIAANVDQTRSKGDIWHQELLRQMASEIELVRPAVVSKEVRNMLDEYRGFRHIVRNGYSYQLSQVKMAPLVNKLPEVFRQIKKEIESFILFLETRGKV